MSLCTRNRSKAEKYRYWSLVLCVLTVKKILKMTHNGIIKYHLTPYFLLMLVGYILTSCTTYRWVRRCLWNAATGLLFVPTSYMSMKSQWNDTDRGNQKLGERLVPMPVSPTSPVWTEPGLCCQQIPKIPPWYRLQRNQPHLGCRDEARILHDSTPTTPATGWTPSVTAYSWSRNSLLLWNSPCSEQPATGTQPTSPVCSIHLMISPCVLRNPPITQTGLLFGKGTDGKIPHDMGATLLVTWRL